MNISSFKFANLQENLYLYRLYMYDPEFIQENNNQL